MAFKFDWKTMLWPIAMAVLGSNPKTAPIVNEVAKGMQEAEGLFKAGADKKQHVLEIARQAAQAADELRGGADDVVGEVGDAVDKIVAATNAVVKVVK